MYDSFPIFLLIIYRYYQMPGIGLHAFKYQVIATVYLILQGVKLFRSGNSAPFHAYLIFNEAVYNVIFQLCCPLELKYVFAAVYRNRQVAALCQGSKIRDLFSIGDLICYQHVFYARFDQILSLAQLCAGYALSTLIHLHMDNGSAFVGFIMWPKTHICSVKEALHLSAVSVKNIKIQNCFTP